MLLKSIRASFQVQVFEPREFSCFIDSMSYSSLAKNDFMWQELGNSYSCLTWKGSQEFGHLSECYQIPWSSHKSSPEVAGEQIASISILSASVHSYCLSSLLYISAPKSHFTASWKSSELLLKHS